MATREELLQAFQNATAAAEQGDPQAPYAARQLAQLLSSGQFDGGNPTPAPAPTPQPQAPAEPQGGTIADPLAQGLTFGFADEIAGGLGAGVNTIANLFGAGTGESFGEAYRGIRDAARGNQAAFAERNPLTSAAAEIGGGLLTGGAGAARAGALQGTQTLGRLAGVGAAQGGLYGAGASEAEDLGGLAQDVTQGAALGGVTGAALPAAGRALGGLLSGGASTVNRALGGGNNAVRQAAVETLEKADIPLTAGQKGGSAALRARETDASAVPVVGAPLAKTFETQQRRVQQNIMRMAGFADDDVSEGLISPEAMQRASERFTDRYTDALKDTKITVGEPFVNALVDVQSRLSGMLAGGRSRKVDNIVNSVFDKATEGNLTGEAYQQLRSELGSLSRSAGEPRLQQLYGDIKTALDDEFLRATDTVTGKAKQQLDREYAQFTQIRDLVRRNAGGAQGVVSGNLPLSQLARMAASRPGTQEWRKFLNSAAAVFPDSTPNSGTAGRNLANLVTGGALASAGAGAGLPAAIAAGAVGRGASAALANPRAVQQGAQVAGQAIDRAGALATPAVFGAGPENLPGSLQNQMRGLL